MYPQAKSPGSTRMPRGRTRGARLMPSGQDTSSGYCECGCGEKTNPAKRTDPRRGSIQGEPQRFVRGHQTRLRGAPACGYVEEDRGYKTPCWVWKRGIAIPQGYGRTTFDGARDYAHRVFWVARSGSVPAGLQLDHLCRVRACCNPDHLEVVTHAENGRRAAHVKLSMEIVREIRESSEGTVTVAHRYGVLPCTVSNIRAGRIWREDA